MCYQLSFLQLISLSILSNVVEAEGSCARFWLREPSIIPTVLQGVVTCTNPALELLATEVLTVRDVVITVVSASGSLIEFCRGTVNILLLTVVLLTLFSSWDELDIGSSNMGVL